MIASPTAALAVTAPLLVAVACLYAYRKLDGGRHLLFWACSHFAIAVAYVVIGFADWLTGPWFVTFIATAANQVWAVMLAAGIRGLVGKPAGFVPAAAVAALLTLGVTGLQQIGDMLHYASSTIAGAVIVAYAGMLLVLHRRSALYAATGAILLGRSALSAYFAAQFVAQSHALDSGLALGIFANLLTGLTLIMMEFDNARQREHVARETEHETRLFLQTLLDAMPATMSCKDRDLRYRMLNRCMRDLMAPYGDGLIGHTWSEIVGADAAAIVERNDRTVLASGEQQHMEQAWVGPDGRPLVLWSLKTPLRDRTGAIQGIITCGIDVTRLKETETQLIEQREAAEAASRTKTAFLANMSHELRTPLNAIIGFAEMMNIGYLGKLSDRQHEYAQHIQQSGEHLLRLVNDILDLSRLESGRVELDIAACSFDRIAEAALAMVEPQARRAEVTLSFTPTNLSVRADERALVQILVNLLGNAVKFSRAAGQVDLRAQISDGVVRIAVEDTGIGMSDAESLAAMQPFHRVDAYRVRPNGGAGLGLSICRSLAELHGGHVTISSQPGRGTRVEVALPA